jgi:hypothetical protein
MDHVDRGEAPRGDGERAGAHGRKPRRRPATKGREQCDAKSFDRLIREGPQVSAALLQAVEELDAGHSLAAHQRLEERFDSLLLDQAEDIANVVGGEHARIRAEQLVEHRLGVSHAAGGQACDEVDGFWFGRSIVRRQDRLRACRRSRRPSAAGSRSVGRAR